MDGIVLGRKSAMATSWLDSEKVYNHTLTPYKRGHAVHLLPHGIILADASELHDVTGFLVEDVEPLSEGYITTDGRLQMRDWTLLTGEQYLTVGARYYVAEEGRITSVVPLTNLFQCVGTAVALDTLSIEIQPPVIRTLS